MKRALSLFLFFGFFIQVSFSQQPTNAIEGNTSQVSDILNFSNNDSSETASTQILEELFSQIQLKKQSLSAPTSPSYKKTLEEISEMETEFEKTVVGEEVIDLFSSEEPQSSLEEEFMSILQPVFGSIKETTSSLREKEDLRIQVEKLNEQVDAINKSLQKMDKVSGALSGELSAEYESIRRDYTSKLKLTEAKKKAIEEKLVELKANDVNPMENASSQLTSFFKSTGLHLLVALSVSSLIFFGVNYAFRKFMEYSKKNAHKMKRLNYEYLATVDGSVFLGSLTLAVLSIPFIFLLFGNWFLISVVALVAILIFWMVKDKIPDMVEEVRLILNVGAVREQERIIYNDLPWIVDEIKFYTRLVNPDLEGGRLRIPIGDLVGMHSRAFQTEEAYFPSSQGDWILIEGEEVGQVKQQTIEYVVLKLVGGSIKTIPTTAFLEMNPVNLTENGFRVSINFGIDYKYQAQAITVIEKQLEAFMKKELLETLDDVNHLKDFFIEFAEAGASSLDYEINAEFTGEVAHLYPEFPCYLQRFAVNACNHYGWEIPFTQIQIHQ